MRIIQVNKNQLLMISELFDEYRVHNNQPSDIKAGERYLTERLEKNDTAIFVAISESSLKPIGFVQMYPFYCAVTLNKNWILSDLFVIEQARKQGVGEVLIDESIHHARNNGAKVLEVRLDASNEIARRLLERLGFQIKMLISELVFYKKEFNDLS